MIDFVEVIQVADAVAGDVAQLHKAVALGIDTVVQQGQHGIPQSLDLGDGGQDCAADQSTEPPGPVSKRIGISHSQHCDPQLGIFILRNTANTVQDGFFKRLLCIIADVSLDFFLILDGECEGHGKLFLF